MLWLARNDAQISKEWCSDWKGKMLRLTRNDAQIGKNDAQISKEWCLARKDALIGKERCSDWQGMMPWLASGWGGPSVGMVPPQEIPAPGTSRVLLQPSAKKYKIARTTCLAAYLFLKVFTANSFSVTIFY
jgi:hypothetical protein